MIYCAVCENSNLNRLHSYKNYPLNSQFLSSYDQYENIRDGLLEIFSCNNCGHIQAESSIRPNDIYNENYDFSSNASGVKFRKNEFLSAINHDFLEIEWNRIIDIGCDDMSLLSKLKASGYKANAFIGIDPQPNNSVPDGFTFLQGDLGNIKIDDYDLSKPDLIVSDQVFEHIPNLSISLREFTSSISENSIFVIGVPDINTILKKLNFHFIIHEHLNYFSSQSMNNLFFMSDSRFEKIWNKQITLPHGGLLVSAFKLGKSNSKNIEPDLSMASNFNSSFNCFLEDLSAAKNQLEQFSSKRILGFGASHLTANLAYFMNSDLSFCDFIIDDTPNKRGKYIPGIKPKICNFDDIKDPKDCVILITAPHTSRPIIRRLLEIEPEIIINPIRRF